MVVSIIWKVFRVISMVAVRRFRYGRLIESWSLGMEMTVELLRPPPISHSKPLHPERFVAIRKRADNIIKRLTNVPKDVTHFSIDVNGIPSEWIYVKGLEESPQVVYYLHGGGYVLLSTSSHRPLMSRISRSSNARIFAINYRLAPEHKFPAAMEDAVAAYQWLIDPEGGNVEPSQIVIAGDSAGGGLTLSTALTLRDRKIPLPGCLCLLSPWVDLTMSKESWTRNHMDYLGTPHPEFPKLYAGEEDLFHPLISPIYADLSGLPPMLIQCGSAEALLDEDVELANNAERDGVECELEVYPDMIHVFQAFPHLTPLADRAVESIAEFISKKIWKPITMEEQIEC